MKTYSRRNMMDEMTSRTLHGEAVVLAELHYENGWRWIVSTENRTCQGIETREEDAAWAARGVLDPHGIERR